ncbi:MAG TPA: hypothetical protein VMA36_06015 [Candidatus Limnocylindria bacterium]|nr:hypothetical protein [Candidatus Limnocylindria bacterium]
MLDPKSRYAAVGHETYEAPDGSRAIYLRRRFLPDADEIPAFRSVDASRFAQRLDLVAARTLGDAFAFWQLCDANAAMNPFDLVAECGGRLRVPSTPGSSS